MSLKRTIEQVENLVQPPVKLVRLEDKPILIRKQTTLPATMLMPGAPLQTLTPVSTPGSPSDLAGLTQKDTTYTKIFVGGLPYHTTDQSLRSHFEVYGEIEEAVVITDRQTGKSRGYGFVTMSDRLAAERACKDPNPIIDGRKANVNLAYLGAKPRGNIATSFPLTGLRAGFPAILPGQFGLTPQLVYQSPFITPQSVMPLQGASQNAISQATMAALASQFYDPAVAAATAYAAQFANMDQLAYSNAAGAAAGLMGPTFTYASALPTTAASLQGVAANPLHFSAYAGQAALQEARMQ